MNTSVIINRREPFPRVLMGRMDFCPDARSYLYLHSMHHRVFSIYLPVYNEACHDIKYRKRYGRNQNGI